MLMCHISRYISSTLCSFAAQCLPASHGCEDIRRVRERAEDLISSTSRGGTKDHFGVWGNT